MNEKVAENLIFRDVNVEGTRIKTITVSTNAFGIPLRLCIYYTSEYLPNKKVTSIY